MNKGFLLSIAGGSLAVLVVASGVAAAGFRVNVSSSVPLGIYRAANRPIAVGEYVQLCPPNKEPFIEAKRRGYLAPGKCPGGFGYMFKKVLAAKSDVVTMSGIGMTVNGATVPYSSPMAHDNLMRPMPLWRESNRTLQDHELILMTDINPKSFDSRYFGPIQTQQIVSVIEPVLTWGAKP